MAALDDPFSLLAILANPASGSGADLIANAMRSYDVFASVRGANVPVLTGNQTLVIDVEGALTSAHSTGAQVSAAGLTFTSALASAPGNGLRPHAL